MSKPAFCKCENKDADQLRGDREADQRLCFCYPSTSYIRNCKLLAILCSCIAWFMSDLVGNLEDRFSHNEAQSLSTYGYQEGRHSRYLNRTKHYVHKQRVKTVCTNNRQQREPHYNHIRTTSEAQQKSRPGAVSIKLQ